MDQTTIENSDSDSVDSWSLVEPAHLDPVSEEYIQTEAERSNLEFPERDDDTDGISIINESDQDLTTNSEIEDSLEEKCDPVLKNTKIYHLKPESLTNEYDHKNLHNANDCIENDNIKLKTYVHKRNKQLSTVLNIIVLGSVITAAGVAIGHMWGVKNDCSLNTGPSVNKILSNLYKLQEENSYLRNKLKELTLIGNLHIQQKKMESNKLTKNNKCKKFFEDSLDNRYNNKFVKCVDNDINTLLSEEKIPVHEVEFLDHLNKLHNTYKQNKSWLDKEINERLRKESKYWKKAESKTAMSPSMKTANDPNIKIISNSNDDFILNETSEHEAKVSNTVQNNPLSYADTVKFNTINKNSLQDEKQTKVQSKEKRRRKTENKDYGELSPKSDESLKKDDRYVDSKTKKTAKKDKRNNSKFRKYQKKKYNFNDLKEMKQLQDFDDISVMSAENEVLNEISSNDNEEVHNTQSLIPPSYESSKNANIIEKGNQGMWYFKLGKSRADARKSNKTLDKNIDKAEWWFQRMKTREHNRFKRNNITYRYKNSKANMNYKTKH